MDDYFQYFDDADLSDINGVSYLTLIDRERNTYTPIRLHSITINGNDLYKWIITIIPDSGCKFRYRSFFDKKELAEELSKRIQLLSNKL